MRLSKQLNQKLVYWQVLKGRQSWPVRRQQLPMKPADRARCHAMNHPLDVPNSIDPRHGNTLQRIECQVLPAGVLLTTVRMAHMCEKQERSSAPGQSWASRLLQR